jgi:hypothetical protein
VSIAEWNTSRNKKLLLKAALQDTIPLQSGGLQSWAGRSASSFSSTGIRVLFFKICVFLKICVFFQNQKYCMFLTKNNDIGALVKRNQGPVGLDEPKRFRFLAPRPRIKLAGQTR